MRKLLFAWSTFVAMACGGAPAASVSDPPAAGASVSLSLSSEAMADTTAVDVTILGVDLLVAGPDGDHLVPVPMDAALEVNLLELRHDARALLGTVQVAGKINQIRLSIGGTVTVVAADGTSRVARVPSGERTGIKIITQGLDPATAGEIELAFDPANSIHETGSGELIMRPTIKLGHVGGDPATGPATAPATDGGCSQGHGHGHSHGPTDRSPADAGVDGANTGGGSTPPISLPPQ